MPSHPQWPELLEEHAYLIQTLSEVAHDPGALEHTCTLLEVLRADLRTCTVQVADLERDNRESSSKRIASNFYHRVTATISSDKEKEKYGLGVDSKQDQLLVVWTTKRTLSTEVKNLEIKAQILWRQKRHHDEFQRRLVALYARISEERKPPSREEDEAEEDARRALHALYEVQITLDQHKTLEALLRHGDYALVNAGRHLTVRGPGGSSGVDAAKRCAVQTSVVVGQARRLDPSFFEQQDAEVLKMGWLREVFQETTADDSNPLPLLQALKPRHTALLSLISQAHKRTSEHETTVRRAAHQASEARARRDAITRQVLATRASAEAERGGEMSLVSQGLEKDGLATMRDITAGLEGVIPIAGAQRSSAAASPPRPSEERRRVGQDEPASRPSPIFIPHPHPHPPQSPRQLLPSNMAPPDSATPPRSAPLPTPPSSSSDPRTHAQHGSEDTTLRQPSPAAAVRQLRSVDVAQRRFSSPDSILQPKPVHQQNRHPVLEYQYDQQWQSESGIQQDGGGSNPPSQGKVSSRTGDREDVIFQPQQPQPQPHPGQRLLQDSQPSPPSSVFTQAVQQNAKTLQPAASNFTKPTSDPRRQPPPSTQNVRSGAAEPRSMLPPIPQSQPARPLPQVNKPSPLYQSDSLDPKPSTMSPPSNVQSGRSGSGLRTASSSSRSSPTPPQPPTPTPPTSSTAKLPSQPPTVHGILKQASVVSPRPSTAADADPWGLGVKVAAAPSSRPQPKLKTVFNLWRSAESSKNAGLNTSRARVASQPEPQPPPESKPPNPRAGMQVLRFSEAVEVIPRPAVDSDPYDDDEENEENELPPSPTRGSMLWLGHGDGDKKESSDDSSGDQWEVKWRPDVAKVPGNTDRSQSSISSSASSSHFTEHSSLSSSTTPPSSGISSLEAHSSPYIPSYYTSQDDDWTPPDTRRGDPDDENKIPAGARESTNKDSSSWLSGTKTTSPQDVRSVQPVIGPKAVSTDTPTPSYSSFHEVTRGSMPSDRELLQTIFPSPAQSSISHRDLMFTS